MFDLFQVVKLNADVHVGLGQWSRFYDAGTECTVSDDSDPERVKLLVHSDSTYINVSWGKVDEVLWEDNPNDPDNEIAKMKSFLDIS
jgi:hypothetical protein